MFQCFNAGWGVNYSSNWQKLHREWVWSGGISSVPDRFPRVDTVYPKNYAHGFVVLCFVVVMQSFIMNSHEVFIHIHQGCFAGTGAIVRLPECQWSKPDGYGKISQCITTTKHSKAKTVCIFLGIYCRQHKFLVTRLNPSILMHSTTICKLVDLITTVQGSSDYFLWWWHHGREFEHTRMVFPIA